MTKATNSVDVTVELFIDNGTHAVTFNGSSKKRTHKRGHQWLLEDPDVVNFTYTMTNGLYDDTASGQPEHVIFTSRNLQKKKFDPFGGVFSKLDLSANKTQLSFTVLNTDGYVYFYKLNLIDSNGVQFPTHDPIIVNKGFGL